MKLEHQVCSLGQAKRLFQLGITQWSIFSYNLYSNLIQVTVSDTPNSGDLWEYVNEEATVWYEKYTVSAFTAPELGIMLPPCLVCPSDGVVRAVRTKAEDTYFNCEWTGEKIFKGSSEVSVRAEMLIYLLENKHLDAGYCNKHLVTN